MPLRIPDWYRYEIRNMLERWGGSFVSGPWRDRINDNPLRVAVITGGSVLLLSGVLAFRWFKSQSNAAPIPKAKQVWFCDLNTGELFIQSYKNLGPVSAPSGPLPDGGDAGFRAHVYSYVLDPNERELFVGFLERPLEHVSGASVDDALDEEKWSRTRMIRRLQDGQWVRPSSRTGRDILSAIARPNRKGQTPIYQFPR